MTDAKAGDTVRIHYTGTLEDGTVFDSSKGREPLEFELGSGQIIQGLDQAITGMATGEEKTVTIPHDLAYGERNPDAMQAIPREAIPADVPTTPGTALQMQTPDGNVLQVTVVEATDNNVILDANHPLAGKALTFQVELVEIL